MPRPIRVLHVIDGLGKGGAERSLWDLVRLSDPAVVAHHVVTYYPEDDSFVFADRLRAAGAYEGARRRRFRNRVGAQALFDAMPSAGKRLIYPMLADFDRIQLHAAAWRRIAAACVRVRPDVVHGHVFHGMRVGARLKAWWGRPLVYTVPSLPAQIREAGAAWVLDDYRRLHPHVDALFIDPAYRGELEALGVPRDRMHGFLGAVDMRRVDETSARRSAHRAAIRHRLGIPADASIALSVGRLTPSKGHRFALDAMRLVRDRCPELHWVAIGDGEERAALEQTAAATGMASRTHLVGYVEDPRPFYAAADLYLRTPVFEGENTSSHDAMAFGLPVAGFDTRCGTDRVGAIRNGVLVPNRDAAALASAMSWLLARPDRGRAIGERGVEFARQHLDIRTTVSIVTGRYVELVKRRNSYGIGPHSRHPKRTRLRAA